MDEVTDEITGPCPVWYEDVVAARAHAVRLAVTILGQSVDIEDIITLAAYIYSGEQ